MILLLYKVHGQVELSPLHYHYHHHLKSIAQVYSQGGGHSAQILSGISSRCTAHPVSRKPIIRIIHTTRTEPFFFWGGGGGGGLYYHSFTSPTYLIRVYGVSLKVTLICNFSSFTKLHGQDTRSGQIPVYSRSLDQRSHAHHMSLHMSHLYKAEVFK